MGWFVISAVGGFFLFSLWRCASSPNDGSEHRRYGCRLGISIGVIAAALTILLASYDVGIQLALGWIGSGWTARVILGAILGFVAGYALAVSHDAMKAAKGEYVEEKPRHRRAAHTAQAQHRHASAHDFPEVSSQGNVTRDPGTAPVEPPRNFYIALALAIAVLALLAPYLDHWLPRITSFKSSVFELQMRGDANHSVAIAENQEVQSSVMSIDFLIGYYAAIQQDIDYLTTIEIKEIEAQSKLRPSNLGALTKQRDRYQDFAARSRHLLVAFQGLISPIAECVRAAERGGMSTDRLRDKVRPIADLLANIVRDRKADVTKHRQFWNAIEDLAEQLHNFKIAGGKGCGKVVRDYRNGTIGSEAQEEEAYPRIEDYADLPYLYVAAALFMRFAGDDDLALTILEDNYVPLQKEGILDYTFMLELAQLRYYRGDDAVDSVPSLENMREIALEHLSRLTLHCSIVVACDKLDSGIVSKLTPRETRAEVRSTNTFTYFVSEDLARGISSARQKEPLAEKYALELKKAADSGEFRMNREALLDTYAYAEIVLEALKPDPNTETFKQMKRILEEVVVELEGRSKNPRSRLERTDRNIARAHLAAARQLAGE